LLLSFLTDHQLELTGLALVVRRGRVGATLVRFLFKLYSILAVLLAQQFIIFRFSLILVFIVPLDFSLSLVCKPTGKATLPERKEYLF